MLKDGAMPDTSGVATIGRPPLTEEVLQTIVQRLVDVLHPEEIVLFGSHAYGEPREESDVDLLVIMQTDVPLRERWRPVWESVRDLRYSLDIQVRTPAEIERALAIGNFFVREIATRGRVLYARGALCHPTGATAPLDLTFPVGGEVDEVTDPMAWVQHAEDDYSTSLSALRRKRPMTTIACFHIQQCIEKYLKAALVSRGQGFPKTHELPDLANLLDSIGIFVPIERPRLEALTKYAVATRYPGHEPTPEEAREALTDGRTVRRFVRRLLGI